MALAAAASTIALGVPGVVIGRRAQRAHGPDFPMQYPVPLPRLVRHTVSATWVVRVGALLIAMSPVLFMSVWGWDEVNPWSIARRLHSPCRTLVSTDDLHGTLGARVSLAYVNDDGYTCSALYVRDASRGEQSDVLTVTMSGAATAYGQDPESMRARGRLSHQGYAVEDLPDLSAHALLAMAPENERSHIVLWEEHGHSLRLELAAELFSRDQVASVLAAVSEHRRAAFTP